MATQALRGLRWAALGLLSLAACVGGSEAAPVTAGSANGLETLSTAAPTASAQAPVVVEPTPAMDPVVEFPSEPVWREFWFPIENPDRDRGPLSSLILNWANPQPGMAVADLGAGGGYYTFRLADAVGAEGHVWAVDVDGRMTRKVAWEAHARGVSQVTALRVQRGNLGLLERSLDLAVMIDTGALNSCRPADNARYFSQVASALNPGAHFLFMDATHDSGTPDPMGGADGCRTPTVDEVAQLASADFTELRRQEVATGDVWRGYLILLQRKP